jgi:hypothetical protein
MSDSTKRTLLASPRGYCAGVDRAVVTVEKALEHFGAPVYMRKQIVHNRHVVEVLEERGAVFVDEPTRCPRAPWSCSPRTGCHPRCASRPSTGPAHHRCDLPAGHQGACRGAPVRRRRLRDPADRPRGPRGGRGHGGRGARTHHPRPGPQRGAEVEVRDPSKMVWLSQTTLSVDETMQTVTRLRERFPGLQDPPERRHLLRHPEPTGRREGGCAAGRPADRRRLGQLVELRPARRGRARRGCEDRLPRRQRERDRRGLAGRRADRGRDQRGLGAGVAGASA